MDWSVVLETDKAVLEGNERLLNDFYEFITQNDLPSQDEDPTHLTQYLSVIHLVMRKKGVEFKELEEEAEDLINRQTTMEDSVGLSEKDLLEKIAVQDKELRQRHSLIQQLQERAGAPPPSATNEIRHLRDQLEDLQHESSKVKRSLLQEKAETDRLVEELSAERLKVRQLERSLNELQHTVDDYHGQVQRSKVKGGAPEDNNYRRMMMEKEVEYSKLLDDFQLMANSFDECKQELKSVSVRLEQSEEERRVAVGESQQMRKALSLSDSRCDELESRNKVLESQVTDLQDRVSDQTGADQQIMTMITSKAKEWETVLSSKQSEVDQLQDVVRDLEGQLRVAQRQTDRASVVKIKKRLQEQDRQLSSLQNELSQAVHTITSLTDQLEGERGRGDTRVQRETEVKVQRLERGLAMEIERRKQCEDESQEKDGELASLRKRIWDYEHGVSGLSEAVEAIKKKKEELAVRDNDIAELTRHINRLENRLNQFSEENEALRDQLGIGVGHKVDLSPLRLRKRDELDMLRKDYKVMENEMEHLKEDNLSLRKQLVQATMTNVQSDSSTRKIRLTSASGVRSRQNQGQSSTDGVQSSATLNHNLTEGGDQTLISDLRTRVDQLERECVRERRAREEVVRERDRLRAGKNHPPSNSDPPIDTSVHSLRSELSVLSGQNRELREMVTKSEREAKEMFRENHNKQYKIDSLEKEVRMLKSSRGGFQPLSLPEGLSPTSSDVITSLNEHLLHVLSTLHQREQEVGVAQEALEKFQRKFSVIIHQQGLLYKEYSDSRRSWEQERDKLISDNKQLAAYREQDQVHIQLLKSLQDSLSLEPDDLKKKLSELSRQNTLLLVNERSLTRRYSLLVETEKLLRMDNSRLNQDLVNLERAATERIGHLQRHKETSLFQLSSLQSKLSESVPTSLLDQANREHNTLVIKYQELLQRQTAYTATTTIVEHLQSEVKTLSEQLDSVKQELLTEKQKNKLFDQTTPASSRGERRDSFVTMEMKELNERQRADLATTRCRQLQETLLQLEQRNTSLEDKFSELSQKLLKCQSREAELRDQLASALTEQDKSSLLSEIAKLSETESQLRYENSQLKEVSEVARQQAVAMEMRQKSHDIEISSLRHQLLDLQMQSDEKTVLGKLHHQIIALQISEAKALKSLEDSRTKIAKLEANLLRCEQQRDSLNDTVSHLKSESYRRTRHLCGTIQGLRRQFAGCLPLCEQERHVELLAKVMEDRGEAERMREEARRRLEEAQDKLSELELQHSNMQELLGTLKDDPTRNAAKLTEWHSKLGEMRLREMKTNRENGRLREKIKHLEDLLSKSESSFTRLEGDLVQLTKEFESSQDNWERREGELERQLEEIKKEKMTDRPETVQLQILTHTPHATHSTQDTTHSTQDTSHSTQGTTHSTQGTTHSSQGTAHIKERAERLERALAEAQRVLLEREREVTDLRAKKESDVDRVSEDVRRMEAERKLEIVNENVEQLKAELSEKDRLTEKYQRLLQQARQELKDNTLTHKKELVTLTEQLQTQSDTAFSKLKEAALQVVNIPQANLPTDSQLDRLQELEDLTSDQESIISRLRDQVGELKRDIEQVEQDYQTRLSRLRDTLDESTQKSKRDIQALQSSLTTQTSRVTELEQELEVLEGELSASQQAAKQAPSRTMKALVERLRNQLTLKEKQQRALSQALVQVRSDLVETAQKTVEGESAKEIQEANIKLLVDKKTTLLQDRISELSQRLDDLTTQLEDARSREAEKQEELSLRQRDIGEFKCQVQRLTAELEQRRRGLEQAKSREKKLANEIHQLTLRLEQSPPEVEELQKRIKILQGKLEREKSKTGDEISRLASLKASGSKKNDMSMETSHQVDDKHRTVEVLKWEESKKWQRRVDTLRARLTDKQKELEGTVRTVQSLKETLARSDREKSILQGKLKQKTHQEQSVTKGESKPDQQFFEERQSLQRRIFDLEGEVSSLKTEIKNGKENELFESKMRCQHLRKTVENLEEQLQQQHLGSNHLHSLREREKQLQEDLLQSQKENMTLRFNYEQAILDLPRLKARIDDQHQYIEVLKSSEGAGNVRSTSKKDPPRGTPDLERVINAMRKVIDKLQSENDSLKTKTKSKNTSLTALERENKRLKSEVDSLSAQTGPPSEWSGKQSAGLRSPLDKIVSENERLRKELKKDQDQIDKLHLTVSTLELQNKKLQQDQGHSTHSSSEEERVERLQVELDKKTAMLMEVKTHLREAADRERHLKSFSTDPNLSDRYLTVSSENEMLKEQVLQLKKELDSFDPSFFEEIEDLKFNYQECVRRNVQFEEQIKRLSEQYGFPLKQTNMA